MSELEKLESRYRAWDRFSSVYYPSEILLPFSQRYLKTILPSLDIPYPDNLAWVLQTNSNSLPNKLGAKLVSLLNAFQIPFKERYMPSFVLNIVPALFSQHYHPPKIDDYRSLHSYTEVPEAVGEALKVNGDLFINEFVRNLFAVVLANIYARQLHYAPIYGETIIESGFSSESFYADMLGSLVLWNDLSSDGQYDYRKLSRFIDAKTWKDCKDISHLWDRL